MRFSCTHQEHAAGKRVANVLGALYKQQTFAIVYVSLQFAMLESSFLRAAFLISNVEPFFQREMQFSPIGSDAQKTAKENEVGFELQTCASAYSCRKRNQVDCVPLSSLSKALLSPLQLRWLLMWFFCTLCDFSQCSRSTSRAFKAPRLFLNFNYSAFSFSQSRRPKKNRYGSVDSEYCEAPSLNPMLNPSTFTAAVAT